MWNNKDYEKRLTPSSKKGQRNSKKIKKLPPIPTGSNTPKIDLSEFENYLQQGGYLEKNSKQKNLKESSESILQPPSQKKPSKVESDFTTSLLKRVSHLEKTLKNYRAELREKTLKIDELKEKLETYEKYFEEKNQKKIFEKILNENKKIKSEILKIKSFLESYGIKWKGIDEILDSDLKENLDISSEIIEENFNVNKLLKDTETFNYPVKYKKSLPKEIDIYTISQRIQELNALILKEQGTKKFTNKNNYNSSNNDKIFRLEDQKPLYLIFYKDAVHLEKFPVFQYGSKDAIALISDIIDGFFPRQLEKEFPDGILIKLIDRLDESFKDYQKADKGVRIGGILSDENEGVGRAVSKNEFLGKLGKRIIKDGKIVEVRDEVAKIFEGKKDSKIEGFNLVMNHQYGDFTQENITDFKEFDGSEGFLEKNRRLVKFGDRSYMIKNEIWMEKGSDFDFKGVDLIKEGLCVVKMRLGESDLTLLYYEKKDIKIEKLKEEIKRVFGNSEFRVVNNFPKEEISFEGDRSFEEAGFFPRAAVHLLFGG